MAFSLSQPSPPRAWLFVTLFVAGACSHISEQQAPGGKARLCRQQAETTEKHLTELDGQAALLSAQEALRLCPDSSETWIALGRALAAADRLEEACRMLERARAEKSRSRALFFTLVSSYDVLGDQTHAAEAALDYLSDHEGDIAMRSNLASALVHLGDFTRAVAELDNILRVHPEDVALWDAKAHACLEAGDAENARAAAQGALALEPTRIESRILCVRALHAGGRVASARQVLESLLTEHPRQHEALGLKRQLDEAFP